MTRLLGITLATATMTACGGHSHHHPTGHRFENAAQWAERWDAPERDAWQRPEAEMRLAADAVIAEMKTAGYTPTTRDEQMLPRQYVLVFERAGP